MDTEISTFEEQLDECRTKLIILCAFGNVRFQISHFFIEHSAYWNHPKAGWVRAPKHADRMETGPYGQQVRFGGNYFLVELAIKRCASTVADLLVRFENGNEYSYEDLVKKLYLNVRGAVANHDGNEYDGYYPISGNDLVFGTQSIDVRDFVGIVTATTKISKLYNYL
ncbi:MAG: hypothetical protein ACK4ML_16150 [Alishewanella aestuarii]